MGKIKVKFYKTVLGKDQLKMTRYFDSLEEAEMHVDEWESRTPDNYAVYC